MPIGDATNSLTRIKRSPFKLAELVEDDMKASKSRNKSLDLSITPSIDATPLVDF
jgi:hypothetical protein